MGWYKVGTPSKTDLGWATSNMNVAYQAIQAKQLGCQGYALFRYAWLGTAAGHINITPINLRHYVINISRSGKPCHARAMGDAMYPSAYFPWSIYISEDRSNPGYESIKAASPLPSKMPLCF